MNIGSQLIKKSSVQKLLDGIKTGKIKSWDEVHDVYAAEGNKYADDKLQHAFTALLEILNITSKQFTPAVFKTLLLQAIETRSWMCKGIYDAREKDYTNPFRKMVYETNEEMNNVIGSLEDNSFIQGQLELLDQMKKEVKQIIKKWTLQ